VARREYLGGLIELLAGIEAAYAAADAKGAGTAEAAANAISLGPAARVGAGGDVVRALAVEQGPAGAVTGADRHG